MFDTHCHLNFQRFAGRVDDVVRHAKEAGINFMVVPGTDEESSVKALAIAGEYEGVYAAVGIHPHHVFQINRTDQKIRNQKPDKPENPDKSDLSDSSDFIRYPASDIPISSGLSGIEKLLKHQKVVAIGEVGIDRHIYRETKYADYRVEEAFIESQKKYLKAQIDLAIKYSKSLILHNREAKKDMLEVIGLPAVAEALAGKAVFHCCEPDEELLNFAKAHRIYIGVDGDVTYNREKQEFVKKIPLELLVLETDSPFLLPEPLRSQKLFPNEPKNLLLVAEFIAVLKNTSTKQLIEATTENAFRLFQLKKD